MFVVIGYSLSLVVASFRRPIDANGQPLQMIVISLNSSHESTQMETLFAFVSFVLAVTHESNQRESVKQKGENQGRCGQMRVHLCP